MNNSDWSVKGFQFEPELRDGARKSPDYNEGSNDNSDINDFHSSRLDMPDSSWCQCGQCKKMPKEIECLCCHEMDKIKFDGT